MIHEWKRMGMTRNESPAETIYSNEKNDPADSHPKIESKSEAIEMVKGMLDSYGIPYKISKGAAIVETVKPCRIRQQIRIHSDVAVVLTSRRLDKMPSSEYINDLNSKTEIGAYYIDGNNLVYRNYAYLDGQFDEKLAIILADGKRKSIEFSFERNEGGIVYG
ncbi:MAG: hypothetical protein IKP20_02525 [Candidatus Methanomethylophilaceae archaeon]|nr:hypothetical protein [Candidatus Methanomethylophilaceae archaeon]